MQISLYRESMKPSLQFNLAKLTLSILYAFCNPYRHCRKFLQKRGEKEIYGYGETPLKTLQIIAEKCEATSSDTWLELGAGRGLACFWIALNVGCKTIGVEWIPRFVNRAGFTAKIFSMNHLHFKQSHVLNAPFYKATIVYLYGTSWDDELIEKLEEKMKMLPKGSKIACISFPLKYFSLVETFPVVFPWGETECYLHIS